MLKNVAIGTLMMMMTTAIHSLAMVITFRVLSHSVYLKRATKRGPLVAVIGTVLMMFAACLAEVSLWAAAFLLVGAISKLEPAVYLSTVTFTTLGYGDLVLDEPWRLLASFEAVNGIILFGWTTALVIAIVQRAYAPVLQHVQRELAAS